MSSLFNNLKKTENVPTQKYHLERQLWAQTQNLQMFKKFYMS